MAKLTITDSAEFASPPAGVYAATCKAIEESGGQFGPSYKWVWELVEVLSTEDDDTAEEFIGEEIWGWSSQSASTQGKFVKWAAAHLGQQMLSSGQVVDTDDFIGATVRLTIEHTTKPDGTTGHKVTSVGVHKAKAKRRVVVEDEYDDDEPQPVAVSGKRRAGEPF